MGLAQFSVQKLQIVFEFDYIWGPCLACPGLIPDSSYKDHFQRACEAIEGAGIEPRQAAGKAKSSSIYEEQCKV